MKINKDLATLLLILIVMIGFVLFYKYAFNTICEYISYTISTMEDYLLEWHRR